MYLLTKCLRYFLVSIYNFLLFNIPCHLTLSSKKREKGYDYQNVVISHTGFRQIRENPTIYVYFV